MEKRVLSSTLGYMRRLYATSWIIVMRRRGGRAHVIPHCPWS